MSGFSFTQTSPNIEDQLAIVTRDAALKAAGLNAQATINAASINAAGVDLQAAFAQQNSLFQRDFLQRTLMAQQNDGQAQLGKVRGAIAASGLKLSGTAADVYRNEQRKIDQGLQNINLQGQGQINQLQQQMESLRMQSSQIKATGTQQAELGLRLADIGTHRFI